MGGLGSGGWNATGRPTTADFLCLDVNSLNRSGVLHAGRFGNCQWSQDGEKIGEVGIGSSSNGINLTYNSRIGDGDWVHHQQSVAVLWEDCRFGGQRPYFQCPSCHRRVLKLYARGEFRCRQCHRVSYPSQRERESDRAQRRANQIRKRLGGEPGWHNVPARPKGMHRQTYLRLADEIKNLDAVTDDVAIRILTRVQQQITAGGFWV